MGNQLGHSVNSGHNILKYQSGTYRLQTISGGQLKIPNIEPPLYTYNVFGQRISKKVGAQITVYHYDLAGQLIAETEPTGKLIKAYVWLQGQPLAMIDANGSIYYYHNDHLGTPQRMTDKKGIVVWAADYLPFGQTNIMIETVENNLRFPGQYYDVETGLHYNYHRYYDPKAGRYITPDPIGLAGGINPYTYCLNNPSNFIDPLWT